MEHEFDAYAALWRARDSSMTARVNCEVFGLPEEDTDQDSTEPSDDAWLGAVLVLLVDEGVPEADAVSYVQESAWALLHARKQGITPPAIASFLASTYPGGTRRL